MTTATSISELANLCVPGALIFADHEDHIADARARAEVHITSYIDSLEAETETVNGIDYTIKPRDIEWRIDWSQTNADGSRKYPDKPEVEMVFEPAKALALMLLNETIFTAPFSADIQYAGGHIGLLVGCNDVFAWGCADCENLPFDRLEALYRLWIKEPRWGAAVWCMIERNQMPQGPVEKRMREAGWDLDALRAEHGLLPNAYDGLSKVQADMKFERYRGWAIDRNVPVIPRDDAQWWHGWREYAEANAGWYDDAWKAESETRRAAWLADNGYKAADA